MKKVFDRAKSGTYIGDNSGPFYFFMLQTIFTDGVERFAQDTDRRAKFVSENEHLVSCSVLCLLFAYLESTLGGKSKSSTTWIERHGGKATEELLCLRIVRNAFVHTNSIVTDLESVTTKEIEMLKTFISKLDAGKVIDDKSNIYPKYMDLSEDGNIRLNSEAILTFTSIGRALSH